MFKKYFLAIVVLSLFCITNVYAQFAGGSGTEADPYQVATAEHLNNVRDYLNSYFIQTASIDLGVAPWNVNEGWEPIGTSENGFTGSYDGNGFFIGNLMINRPSSDYVGLFGYLYNAVLNNLEIENIFVLGGGWGVGGIAGRINYSSIVNSHTSGSIEGSESSVGGLTGSSSNSTISQCYANCDINGDEKIGGLIGQSYSSSIISSYALGNIIANGPSGGLVGYQRETSTISNCYANCSVVGDGGVGGLIGNTGSITISCCYSNGTVSGNYFVGGLLGILGGNSALSNSYSTSNVFGSVMRIGGLVGYAGASTSSISNTYAIGNVSGNSNSIGGLVGENNDTLVENSYWNTSTTGQTYSAGGYPRTTDEMTYPYATNTYLFWDFTNIWADDENYTINNGYPYLYQYPLSVEEFVVPFSKCVISNYPNPFNPSTTILYDLHKDSKVEIEVFNVKGQNVKSLVDQELEAGKHTIVWNGDDASGKKVGSGIYFYKMKAGNYQVSKKMILLK